MAMLAVEQLTKALLNLPDGKLVHACVNEARKATQACLDEVADNEMESEAAYSIMSAWSIFEEEFPATPVPEDFTFYKAHLIEALCNLAAAARSADFLARSALVPA
jgi:hypothetical protein